MKRDRLSWGRAVLRGFASIGEGLLSIFSFGRLPRTPPPVVRDPWDDIEVAWREVGDSLRAAMDDFERSPEYRKAKEAHDRKTKKHT